VKSTRVVDTNVILRYLLADHEGHFGRAKAFMDKVRDGEIRAYVSDAVLAECVYVLLKVYEVPKQRIADSLSAILSLRGTTGPNVAAMQSALGTFAVRNIDFVDALVLAVAEHNNWPCFSFDRDVTTG